MFSENIRWLHIIVPFGFFSSGCVWVCVNQRSFSGFTCIFVLFLVNMYHIHSWNPPSLTELQLMSGLFVGLNPRPQPPTEKDIFQIHFQWILSCICWINSGYHHLVNFSNQRIRLVMKALRLEALILWKARKYQWKNNGISNRWDCWQHCSPLTQSLKHHRYYRSTSSLNIKSFSTPQMASKQFSDLIIFWALYDKTKLTDTPGWSNEDVQRGKSRGIKKV